jgi:hypothetical protein
MLYTGNKKHAIFHILKYNILNNYTWTNFTKYIWQTILALQVIHHNGMNGLNTFMFTSQQHPTCLCGPAPAPFHVVS